MKMLRTTSKSELVELVEMNHVRASSMRHAGLDRTRRLRYLADAHRRVLSTASPVRPACGLVC